MTTASYCRMSPLARRSSRAPSLENVDFAPFAPPAPGGILRSRRAPAPRGPRLTQAPRFVLGTPFQLPPTLRALRPLREAKKNSDILQSAPPAPRQNVPLLNVEKLSFHPRIYLFCRESEKIFPPVFCFTLSHFQPFARFSHSPKLTSVPSLCHALALATAGGARKTAEKIYFACRRKALTSRWYENFPRPLRVVFGCYPHCGGRADNLPRTLDN